MDKTTQSLTQAMQECGLRPSPQRLAVYKYLHEHTLRHPTVDDIYTAISPDCPTLSRTTVYQTLEALCASGLAVKLTVEDGEMRFDAETFGHAHFKCTQCGEVFNIRYPETTSFPQPGKGFQVKQTHLYYRGLCPACTKK